MTHPVSESLTALNDHHRKASMSNPSPAEAVRILVESFAEQMCRVAEALAKLPGRDAYTLAPTPADAPADASPTPVPTPGDDDIRDRLAAWLYDRCAHDPGHQGISDDPRTIAHYALLWPELPQVFAPDNEGRLAFVQSAADAFADKLTATETALALLHEGEEPRLDDRTVATPAQWIWCWNRATPANRLAVATQIHETADRADTAEAAIRRVRKLSQDWAVLRTYGSAAYELRTALDGLLTPADEPGPADA